MQSEITSSPVSLGDLAARALTEASREHCTRTLNAKLTANTLEPSRADEPSVWFGVQFDGALQGLAHVVVKRADMAKLGLSGSLATPEAEEAVLLDVLQRSGVRLQELAAHSYGALTVAVEQVDEALRPNVTIVSVEVGTEEDGTRATLSIHLESQLLSELKRSAGSLFPEAVSPHPPAENLGLVLDVELSATLRFGQRQLSLREILDLNSGSVVELDRQVDEPVELVLDGRVIARGEAVIIDGNYGMRITEILHPVKGTMPTRHN